MRQSTPHQNMLSCTLCCSVLQCVAVCCRALLKIRNRLLRRSTPHQNILCATVWCNVLQCVAESCSVLHVLQEKCHGLWRQATRHQNILCAIIWCIVEQWVERVAALYVVLQCVGAIVSANVEKRKSILHQNILFSPMTQEEYSVFYSVVHCVALCCVCCGVLQCVAVRCEKKGQGTLRKSTLHQNILCSAVTQAHIQVTRTVSKKSNQKKNSRWILCDLSYKCKIASLRSRSRSPDFGKKKKFNVEFVCGLMIICVGSEERWGAWVETQKNVRGEIGGWGRVPFNEPYAPSWSTIYDGA